MMFVVLHGYRLNIFPASRGLLRRESETSAKSETSAGLRSLLSCCRRPHLSPKLTGFQNWFLFNVECACPVETAESGNF